MMTGGGNINISYMDNYKGHFMEKKKELDSKIQNEEKIVQALIEHQNKVC